MPLVLDSGDPHQEEPFRHFVARGWQRVRGGAYQSANFPTTPHSFQPDAGGVKDVFVLKIGLKREPGVSFVPTTLTFPAQAIGTTQSATKLFCCTAWAAKH